MKKQFFAWVLVLITGLIGGEMRQVWAFYDDVHYSLNYTIARIIGFTPEQAYRMANACVSVDWTPETEPTQMSGGIAQLRANKMLAAEYLPLASVLKGLGLKYLGSPNEWEQSLGEVPAALEGLMRQDEFRETFDAQWRFHAFRDLYRFPDAKTDGPPYSTSKDEVQATAADEAIVKQRNLLFEESFETKNPGIFLHFFQDEVPHHGYAIGGGHWVLLPNQWKQGDLWEQGAHGLPVPEWQTWGQWANFDKRGSMPSGSTTDWLSYRSLDSNLKLVRETADYMIKFMQRASKGKQKPLVDSPDRIAEMLSPTVSKLREVNPVPPRLRSMKEVIDAKLFQAGKVDIMSVNFYDKNSTTGGGSPLYKEQMYGKHARGPSVKAAHDVLNPFLRSMGMETIPHIEEPPDKTKIFVIKKAYTPGAKFVNGDESALYGILNIKIDDPGVVSKQEKAPAMIELYAFSVPAQTGEQAYEIKKVMALDSSDQSLNGQELVGGFSDLPMGEVDIKAHYIEKGTLKVTKKIEARARLDKSMNELVMKAQAGPQEETVDSLDAIIAALKSMGFKVRLEDSKEKSTYGIPQDVIGERENSRNFPERPLTAVRIIPFSKEEEARKSFERTLSLFSSDTMLEAETFEIGTEDKAVATLAVQSFVGYPESGGKYARGQSWSYFRCGRAVGELQHWVEVERASVIPVPYKYDAAEEDRFEQEENQMRVAAKGATKTWAQLIVTTLASHKACQANPHSLNIPQGFDPGKTMVPTSPPSGLTVPPAEPTSPGPAGNWPSPGGVNQPAVGQVSSVPYAVQPAGSYTSPEAQQQRRNEFMQSAASNPSETLRSSLGLTLSSAFVSTAIPDPVATDLFAAVSIHIARRNLPLSCFQQYAYVNEPTWEAHQRWSQQQGRENSRQHVIWKTDAAMVCLSKPGQDNLYSDIAEAMAQAWQGNVIHPPDINAQPTWMNQLPPPANPTPQAVLGTYQPPQQAAQPQAQPPPPVLGAQPTQSGDR